MRVFGHGILIPPATESAMSRHNNNHADQTLRFPDVQLKSEGSFLFPIQEVFYNLTPSASDTSLVSWTHLALDSINVFECLLNDQTIKSR